MTGTIDITPGRVLGDTELVDNAKLNDLGRPVLRIKAGAIGTREMADGVITADKLDTDLSAQLGVADNSVTTAKVVDGAITEPKLSAEVQAKLVEALAVAQVASVEFSAFLSTAIIYGYASVPTSTGGVEVMSLAMTPTENTSKIRVQFCGSARSATSGGIFVFALFRDTTCISAKTPTIYQNALGFSDVTFDVLDAPSTDAAVTYSVRFGQAASYGAVTVNGVASQLFGGAMKQVLTLSEIKV